MIYGIDFKCCLGATKVTPYLRHQVKKERVRKRKDVRLCTER